MSIEKRSVGCITGKICMVAFLVAVAVFLAYLPALRNSFVNMDDVDYVINNRHIKHIDLEFFSWAFSRFYAANWHPLTWLSHAIDYSLWGLNPMGHHLTSTVLHSLNCFLIVLLSIKLLLFLHDPHYQHGVGDRAAPQRILLISGVLTGLLFGLHPVNVESAAWISQRKNVLCMFFLLLSLLAYTGYVYSAKERILNRSWFSDKKYLMSLLLFMLALLSKPMAVTIPLVLLILDWYPFRRFGNERSIKIIAEKIPFLLLSVDMTITTILAQQHGFAVKPFIDNPLGIRIAIVFKAMVAYLSNIVWPTHLGPLYLYPQDVSFLSLEYLWPFLVVVALTVICLFIVRKQRAWLAVWAFFLITLLPVLGLIRVGEQFIADRYLYLPSAGILLLISSVTAAFFEKLSIAERGRRKGRLLFYWCSISLIMLLLFSATTGQIRIWQDSTALWNRAIEIASKGHKNSNIFILYDGLGMAYYNEGKFDEAGCQFLHASLINSKSKTAYNMLGLVSMKQGRFDEAVTAFHKALSIDPYDCNILNNLGLTYIRMHRTDDAIQTLQTALKINPLYYLTHHYLGMAYLSENRPGEAIAHLQIAYEANKQAIEIRELLVVARVQSGNVLEREERLSEAVQAYRDALTIDKDNAEARNGITRINAMNRDK